MLAIFTIAFINMKPILAITMGDPAGIGPEITVRALNRKETYEKCRPVVTGDAAILCQAVQRGMPSLLELCRE